ncbi:MAG: methionine gamma-lyase family protein, partial [Christensenellaceae bacterium]|nr:methionine gamma-lyase family protein [Christensenellaceae bacterium]
TEEELVAFIRAVQKASPVDSNVAPYPWEMPGYEDPVIMAAGTFMQGGSIELSADAPIRKPYTAYMQGGMVYENVKLAVIFALEDLLK